MKKSFLIAAATLLGAAFYSCEGPGEQPGGQPGGNKLVDVVIKVDRQPFAGADGQTRLHVSPAGITSWSPGDDVTIVDHGEANYGQPFLYTLETSAVQGNFAGQLLSGYGPQVYYAYHKAAQIPAFSRVGHVLTLGYDDMDVDQGDQDIRQLYGNRSTMVAVPKVFDVDNPDSDKLLYFHHVNCLIEASISSKPSDGRIAGLEFDAVEFIVEATDGSYPFSTEVTVDLTEIQGPNPVVIPFTDNDATKIDRVSTTIRYDGSKTIAQFEPLGTNGTFGVAIVALPSDTRFEWIATVNFYEGGVLVGKLQRPSRAGSPARGLSVSGLNVIDFTEDQWVPLADSPDPNTGNNGNGNGKDKDKDKGGNENNDNQGSGDGNDGPPGDEGDGDQQ